MHLWLALLAVTAPGRTLSTDAFARVFVPPAPLRLTLAAGDATTLVVTDVAGHEIARRPAPAEATTIDLGALPPGYYEATAGGPAWPFVVVVDPTRRVPGPSAVATDNAMSWLVRPPQHAAVAGLLRACGLGLVRERLSWGDYEPAPGQFRWDNRCDQAVTALTAAGLQVYDIFHSIPGWARADHDARAVPDDLRVVHRFCAALARHYRGRVVAWEVWNEPDIGFFSHPAGELAAFQKAAFLGFRSADPQVKVLGPSLAGPPGAFAAHLLDNGVAPYCDVWNYHVYADPKTYAERYDQFRRLLAAHGAALPTWVTEAGDHQTGPDGVLPAAARRHQAAFLSRAFPAALAAGEDVHFWFVFPFYREGTQGWGLFEPDQKVPFPAVAALSTACYALGQAQCLGTVPDLPAGVHAVVFARGDQTLAVAAWHDGDPLPVTLPWSWDQVAEALNHVGTPLPAGSGPLTLTLGSAATYLVLPAGAVTPRLSATTRRPANTAAAPALATIVPRLRLNGLSTRKDVDVYTCGAEPVAGQAEVYNFGPEPWHGSAQLTASGGLAVSPATFDLDVAPGERAVRAVTVDTSQANGPARLTMLVTAAGRSSSPAVVDLRPDPSTLHALAEQPLPLDEPSQWHLNLAGGGRQVNTKGTDGGVEFGFVFAAKGDNWAYPWVGFEPVRDFSAYDGLRFDYRSDPAAPGPIRLMLVEASGASYLAETSRPGARQWQTGTLLFQDMSCLSWMKPDPNGHLDLDQITALRFGCNCQSLSVALELRNLRLVRFTPR